MHGMTNLAPSINFPVDGMDFSVGILQTLMKLVQVEILDNL